MSRENDLGLEETVRGGGLLDFRDPRIESLDNAFRTAISSVGLTLSVLLALAKGPQALLLFTPILFSGFIYPFYVGCLRGTVERVGWRTSLLQRARGWVYFGGGIFIGGIMVVVVLSRNSDLSIFAFLIVLYPALYLWRGLTRWVVTVTGAAIADDDLLVIRSTCGAAFLLPASSVFLEEYVSLLVSPPWQAVPPYIPQLLTALFALLAFVLAEKALTAISTAEAKPTQQISWLLEKYSSRSWLGKVFVYSLFTIFVGATSDSVGLMLAALSIVCFMLSLCAWFLTYSLGANVIGACAVVLVLAAITTYAKVRRETVLSSIPSEDQYTFRHLIKRALDP